jgi:hypothetical protein
MNTLILPIKKVYLEAILAKEKKYEYRADSPFFRSRLSKKYDSIILHYYQPRRIKCKIIKIDKIPNPFLNDPNMTFLRTELIFRIHLKNPVSL